MPHFQDVEIHVEGAEDVVVSWFAVVDTVGCDVDLKDPAVPPVEQECHRVISMLTLLLPANSDVLGSHCQYHPVESMPEECKQKQFIADLIEFSLLPRCNNQGVTWEQFTDDGP